MTSFNNNDKTRLIGGLIFWVGICYFTAWLGAQASPGIASAEWYQSINKPSWNPPPWVFGPVWGTLYTMMGIAAWVVWKNCGFKKAGAALTLFLVQLALNGLWPHIFFGVQQVGWALFEIILLLAAIIITTILFIKKSKLAGWLMVPYIAWVGFASVLNAVIWWLN